jgi:hypothetical protein
MESRLSGASGDDLSRLAWIYVRLREIERAYETAKLGLRRDPGSFSRSTSFDVGRLVFRRTGKSPAVARRGGGRALGFVERAEGSDPNGEDRATRAPATVALRNGACCLKRGCTIPEPSWHRSLAVSVHWFARHEFAP